MENRLQNYLVQIFILSGLFLAAVFYFAGYKQMSDYALMITLVLGTLPPIYRMLRDIFSGHYGIDIIAITAILGSFFLHQYLAGGVILLMLSGGEALEAYALRRARRELSSLISLAPSVAHKRVGGELLDIQANQVLVGDIIVIKPGEVVPVDGVVISGISEVNEAALTGEPVPVEKKPSSHVLSGSINQNNVLEIRAMRAAAESKYEQIIKLVKHAEDSRAPVVRLADRYSIWFTIITFAIAGVSWLIFHDPIRLLAVLVVATPCPLILATPIAIISGISQAARRGIIVKNGGALEKLAEVKALIFDKTGTLTLGAPEVVEIQTTDSSMKKDVAKLASSLDQLSAHVLATSLTKYATKNLNLELDYPEDFKEVFGEGVSGKIKNREYSFGKLSFIKSRGVPIPQATVDSHKLIQEQGKIAVYLSEEKQLLGAVIFADVVRPEIKKLFAETLQEGISHIVMLTGDKQIVAEKIGREIGLSDIHAECLPEDKVREVKEHQKEFGTVAMIGDGINDAPALASADVGISIGYHGSTASSDTSDIVITVNNLERVGTALKISKHVLKIAKQGIFLGIGVSILLMIIASLGYIQPVYGALIQEVLDIIVILNALRVNFEKTT
jgi:heavy metal translocating P-type ATPase